MTCPEAAVQTAGWGFGSVEHEFVRATRARPRGGGRLPGAARAHLAEFRLEPVEENTATRVPERVTVGAGRAFAKCAPPSGRRPTDLCT